MGFVDFLRMLMGWWSNPGGTPPASVTPPITNLAFDFTWQVDKADDFIYAVNYDDDFEWTINSADEIG